MEHQVKEVKAGRPTILCIQLTNVKNEKFSKTPVTFLQDNCPDLLHCSVLRKLCGCVRNITAFCQHLLRLIKNGPYRYR